jgi:hypothetical protein
MGRVAASAIPNSGALRVMVIDFSMCYPSYVLFQIFPSSQYAENPIILLIFKWYP